ncbi:MBOAT family O-acyltransferase [Marivirga sp.]|uniref:MBOAT family O-acyltransferase n=1 Tax=Marivirga sp. TaxID=2018662 RepID=UPI003DA6E9EF
MLFNSIDFAIFLPLVFTIYWLIGTKRLKFQNLLILLASYVFYGWWDWRFLSLVAFSSFVDFFVGLGIYKTNNKLRKKLLLWTSIIVNLGLLGTFKYYNFFLENIQDAFSFFGQNINIGFLNIILPVGISFYTFQTLSYSIDVYKGKLIPSKNFIAFSAFVSFFPQLVAGPIERAKHLLPQFNKPRKFNKTEAIYGLRQMLWGFFKKIVIADNCAEIANEIFNNSTDYNGSTLLIGALFFTFQIYGDFSGYSDIAIGLSRLFGFNLMKNFAFPYFSRDIAEFWRRWHISLSTWFRDYLYIPLGGSKGGKLNKIRNTFIIFIVSGFWHGANWTFIIWGALNAIYFLPLLISKKNRNNLDVIAQGRFIPKYKEFGQMLLTFSLTVIAWIFFRAENVSHAINYLSTIFSVSIFEPIQFQTLNLNFSLIPIIIVFILIEWLGRENEFAIEKIFNKWYRPVRWGVYYTIIAIILVYSGAQQDFIYFQF